MLNKILNVFYFILFCLLFDALEIPKTLTPSNRICVVHFTFKSNSK